MFTAHGTDLNAETHFDSDTQGPGEQGAAAQASTAGRGDPSWADPEGQPSVADLQPDLPTSPERRHRRSRPIRVLVAAAALLIPLLGVVALLMIFQPFADAAGGCGGG